MKRDRLTLFFISLGLSLFVSLGSLGAMASGFALLSSSEMVKLALWCLLCAGTLSGAFQLRLGLPVCLGTAAVIFWCRTQLLLSFETLVAELTTLYHNAYGWNVLSWSDTPVGTVGVFGALMALAYFLSLGVCYTVSRRKSPWLAMPVSLLPVAACLVVTDTVPGAFWLFLLVLGLFLWMLTQSLRRRDLAQSNRLTLRAALPVALCLSLVFLLNPKDSYDKQVWADKLEQAVVQLFSGQTLPEPTEPGDQPGISLPVAGDVAGEVNLQNVGPKSRQTQWVMSVEAPVTGSVYLRGRSYAEYDGSSWLPGDQSTSLERWPDSWEMESHGKITIHTRKTHSVLYTPYYTGGTPFFSGRVKNRGNLSDYAFDYYTLPPGYPVTPWQFDAWGPDMVLPYTELPPEVLAWAKPLAEEILGKELPLSLYYMMPQEVKNDAEKLASYVRSSAEYSLNTPRMPENADFARWFLEESDTGYCVHFASATAVLLRAAGIPCRYVSGYLVDARADTTVDVRLGDAHAWVEYLAPGSCWMVLESTPSGGDSPLIPPETQGPTEPSGPKPTSPSTDPGESTLPQQDTATDPVTGPDDDPDAPGGQNSSWWVWLLLPLLPAAAVMQWWLRLGIRKRRLTSGRANPRALTCWRETKLLARLLKQEPPEALYGLALKARFSQHTLTREELLEFRKYLRDCETELRKKPWTHQILYRLIYALY